MTLAQTISHRAAVACVGLLCFGSRRLPAAETWQSALQQMPLATRVTRLNQTNCVPLILSSFQSNAVVKALIFMPGATDEFYMFHRAGANLTNPAPSVLNALLALTNQSLIRLTFRPPLLLLHTDEDPLEPIITIGHQRTAQKLQQRPFAAIYCSLTGTGIPCNPSSKRSSKPQSVRGGSLSTRGTSTGIASPGGG